MFQPVYRLAIELLLDCEVGHRRRWRRPVPVLFAWREPDDVTGPTLLDRPTPAWARPTPDVTISVWPSGWVCHAVRAPGSNVTLAPAARAGTGASNSGSMRTVPVNQSAGPLADGCEPLRLISISPPGVAAEARTNENVTVASAVCKTDRREHPACRFVLVSLVMIRVIQKISP